MAKKIRKRLSKKQVAILALGAGILVSLLIAVPFLTGSDLGRKQTDLRKIASSSYDSVFFSMYPIQNFEEEDFSTYHGWSILLSSYRIPDLPTMSDYLKNLFSSDNMVTDICLGLDPWMIWQNCHHNLQEWSQQLDDYLGPYFADHRDIQFELLLPYPSMDFWCGLGKAERKEALDSYARLTTYCDAYSNTRIYFIGGEEWLISNPGNYEDTFLTNPLISQRILLLIFCDHSYLIRAADSELIFGKLDLLAEQAQLSPPNYPDLSDWQLVFFGDSIFGNYKGSSAVPGVIAGLSGARTYNYAISGTSAAKRAGNDNAFVDVIPLFCRKKAVPASDSPAFPYPSRNKAGQKLCFLIHYGLNDYFSGCPVENSDDPYDSKSFAGALRSGIRDLKELYPDALILIMTPPFCTYYSNGTEPADEGGGILTDYVQAVLDVAESEEILCLNDYVNLGIQADNAFEYLADGCHLNEKGRYLLGTQILSFLKELPATESR